jgi:CheY-like chemotaxis protein
MREMEEKPTYEEMEERIRLLEADLTTITGGIAHDFNNILSAILGYTELAMGELPAECRPHRNLREVLIGVDRARKVVKRISAFSRRKPDEGSTPPVYPPETRGSDRPAESSGKPLPQGAENVLLVDDEPSLTRLGKQLLEKMGYQVTAQTDSRSALELIRTDPDRFDAVITDQSMPYLTGTALARELRALRPELPVIICTGNGDRRNEEEARRIGVKAFVLKPYTQSTLAGIVRRVLDGEVLLLP